MRTVCADDRDSPNSLSQPGLRAQYGVAPEMVAIEVTKGAALRALHDFRIEEHHRRHRAATGEVMIDGQSDPSNAVVSALVACSIRRVRSPRRSFRLRLCQRTRNVKEIVGHGDEQSRRRAGTR